MPWVNHPNISAIIFAGLPGQESGNSLVDILFGDINPSGKLVFTIPEQATDFPAQVLYYSEAEIPQIDYLEGLYLDYRWFDAKNIDPVYEFGFGLSYTTFQYSDLEISAINSFNGSFLENLLFISFTLVNSGNFSGSEVSQLYLGFPDLVGEPLKVLRGFEKMNLTIGEKNIVTFQITAQDLAIWDIINQNWTLAYGLFQVYVGASSRDIRLIGNFSL